MKRKRKPRAFDPVLEKSAATKHTRQNQNSQAASDSEWWKDFLRSFPPAVRSKRTSKYTPNQEALLETLIERSIAYAVIASPEFRMAKEIVTLKLHGITSFEQLARLENPPPELVRAARRRWKEYRDAREKARIHLAKIVWPLDEFSVCSPVEAHDLLFQFADETEKGVSKPKESLLRLAAKLTAQDKKLLADPRHLAEYLAGDFLNLPDAEQEAFLRRTHRRSPLFQSLFYEAMRYSAGLVTRSGVAAYHGQSFSPVFPRRETSVRAALQELRAPSGEEEEPDGPALHLAGGERARVPKSQMVLAGCYQRGH